MKSLLVEKKPISLSQKLMATTAVIAIASLAFVLFSAPIPEPYTTPLKTMKVSEPLYVKGNGSITSENIDYISSPYSGVIQSISVKEGQLIKPSQLLTQIKNHELELERVETQFARDDLKASAEIKLSELQQTKFTKASELKRLKAIRVLKRTEMEAIKQLQEQGIVSQLDAKKAELALSLAELELETKQSEYTSFVSAFARQEKNLQDRVLTKNNKLKFLSALSDSLNIKSEQPALVKGVFVKKGQVVAHGQKLFELFNPQSMVAQISIPQYSIKSVHPGQVAEVSTPNGSLNGVVDYIDNVVRDGAIKVVIRFNQALPNWLKLEQSIEAQIATTERVEKTTIPKPLDYANYDVWVVYRVGPDNSAKKVNYRLIDLGDERLNVVGPHSDRLVLVPEPYSHLDEFEL